MLVFQTVSPNTRGQCRIHQPAVPVAGDAASTRRQCSECSKQFSTETVLKRHVATMHKGQYPYHCQYCGRGFAATNNLKGHLAKHTGIKPFVCRICKKAFSYSNVLKAHMKKFHPGNAP